MNNINVTVSPQCSRSYVVGTIPVIMQSGTAGANQLWVDANYYPRTNPSGYITGIDTSSFVTGQVVRPEDTGIFYTKDNPSGYITGQDLSNFVQKNETGIFYLNNNPSGFITGVDLSNYVTKGETGHSHPQYFLNTDTGLFYPNSNPSGYITGVNLSNYVTKGETGNFIVSSQTGAFASITHAHSQYALSSDTGQFITVGQTGAFSNADTLDTFHSSYFVNTGQTGNFASSTHIHQQYVSTGSTGNFITTSQTGQFASVGHLHSETGSFITNQQTGGFAPIVHAHSQYALSADTGNFITNNQTGQFYAASNPSGFITAAQVQGGGVTSLEGLSGIIDIVGGGNVSISTTNPNSIIISGVTGDFVSKSSTGIFYTNNNPSGFITGVDLSNYVVKNDTGLFITTGQTGSFAASTHSHSEYYLNSNPSGFVTGNVVRPTETGNFITATQTGQFSPSGHSHSQYYLSTNPSGYITGVDLSNYVIKNDTGSFVTIGQTGQFASAVHSHSETGIFITTGQTGSFAPFVHTHSQYYLNSNPSGFVTGDVVRPTETGSFITTSQTGQFSWTGHSHSQYALSVDTGNFITSSQTGVFSNADTLDTFHSSYFVNTGVTGDFVTTGDSRTLGFMGKVGIWNNNPTESLEIGSITSGGNLIVNSAFGAEMVPAISESDWNTNIVGWQHPVVSGVLNHTGDGAVGVSPVVPVTFVAGQNYKLSLTMSSYSAGSLYVYAGGYVIGALAFSATGNYSVYFTARGTSELVLTPSSSTSRFAVSNVSIKPVSNGSITNYGDITTYGKLMFSGVAGYSQYPHISFPNSLMIGSDANGIYIGGVNGALISSDSITLRGSASNMSFRTSSSPRLMSLANYQLDLVNSSNAQEYNIYNFYNSSINYERATFSWINNSNTFTINTEVGGTGNTLRNISIGGANVGIGIVAPTGKLHVNSSIPCGTTQNTIIADGTVTNLADSQATYGSILFGGNGYEWGAIRAIQTSPIQAWTNRLAFFSMSGDGGPIAERMAIDYLGNVGIGKTAPATKLDVDGLIKASGLLVNYRASAVSDFIYYASDYIVEVTAPDKTLTLPTSVGRAGRMFVAKNSSTGNMILATTSSQTIDGLTGLSLASWDSVTVYSDGANWKII